MDDLANLYITGASVDYWRNDVENVVYEGEGLAGTSWIGERFESPQNGVDSDKSFLDVLLTNEDLESILWLECKSDQLMAREILRNHGYKAFEFWDLDSHTEANFVLITNWNWNRSD